MEIEHTESAEPAPAAPEAMTEREALRWLQQVQGTVYRNKRDPRGDHAWIAVVRTPRSPGKTGKIILAFGNSLARATVAAEKQWHDIWDDLGPVN